MKFIFLFFLTFFISSQALAQPYKTIKVFKPYKWMIGANWTGMQFLGTIQEPSSSNSGSFNIQPYPTQLIIDRYFIYGWSMELDATYAGATTITERLDSTSYSYSSGINASIDILGKYSFYNNYAPKARWIDPFLIFGIGYTYRESLKVKHLPTLNLGAGVNFWIINQLGIRLSASGKIGVYPLPWEESNIYLQYNAGIVFRTKAEKGHKPPTNKKQFNWTKKNKKYKNKGGQ